MKILQEEIMLNYPTFQDYLVPLPMELSVNAIESDVSQPPLMAVAVYRHWRNEGFGKHSYRLVGVRVSGCLPTINAGDSAMPCANCGVDDSPVLVCGTCKMPITPSA